MNYNDLQERIESLERKNQSLERKNEELEKAVQEKKEGGAEESVKEKRSHCVPVKEKEPEPEVRDANRINRENIELKAMMVKI